MVNLRALSIVVLAGCALSACEKAPEPGFLEVKAPTGGTFEIYRIANDAPLQFISEQVGEFNKAMPLAPGSYLVLGDCSSETVILYPGQRETLTAHRLDFVAPHVPGQLDSFVVQCSRSDKTRSRQHISNRYSLNVIHGKRDLLVGMVPMRVEFPDTAKDAPQTLSYKLAALQVADYEGNRQEVSYFVSPVDQLIAATKYQRFGHWEFLLPGEYTVEVNGTRTRVTLGDAEERTIKPALFRVETSSSVDLEQPARVKGSPWLVEINNGHWLNFNETYPVLPGTAHVRIGGSSQLVEVPLEEGNSHVLTVRSVTVDMGCDAHDWSCLGDKEVTLTKPDEPYPFVESLSDMPVLFIDESLPVWVGVAGSRDIAFEVPAGMRDKKVSVGFVKLIPQPQHRPGQVTDLVRVDTLGPPFRGHTLDINLERPTLMPLVAGTYQLSHYLSITAIEGERRHLPRNFVIEAGKTIEIEIPVFFSEKKMSTYKAKPREREAVVPPSSPQARYL